MSARVAKCDCSRRRLQPCVPGEPILQRCQQVVCGHLHTRHLTRLAIAHVHAVRSFMLGLLRSRSKQLHELQNKLHFERNFVHRQPIHLPGVVIQGVERHMHAVRSLMLDLLEPRSKRLRELQNKLQFERNFVHCQPFHLPGGVIQGVERHVHRM